MATVNLRVDLKELLLSLLSHGNALHHNNEYILTKPNILEKVKSMVDKETPRNVYKEMVLDDSIEAPRDFKQVRNIKHRVIADKEVQGGKKGKKGNLADELLECLLMVDRCEFVRTFSKSKDKLPTMVCYTDKQEKDLKFFISQKSGYPIGVDRTFNLGQFFVTALVYKS